MAFANRGKYAEDKVHDYLRWWAGDETHREASRLVDTKSAGRIIKAAKADFEYFARVPQPIAHIAHGLIETKQTEHEYRLERSKVTQLASLRKRDKCGGKCYVIVYHTAIKCWRAISVDWLMSNGDKGSWNLQAIPTFATAGEALGDVSYGVFMPQAK